MYFLKYIYLYTDYNIQQKKNIKWNYFGNKKFIKIYYLSYSSFSIDMKLNDINHVVVEAVISLNMFLCKA